MSVSYHFAGLLGHLDGVSHTFLTMTLASTVAALVVMVLRLALKRAPTQFIISLWVVVIVRMLSPFGYGVGFVSLIPEPVTSGRAAEYILEGGRSEEWSPATVASTEQTIDLPPNWDGALAGPIPAEETDGKSAEKPAPVPVTPAMVISEVWLAGTTGVLLWTLIAYIRLRHRVAEAVMVEPDVYETDQIDAPFVLGSDIYLPAGLDEPDRRYVLLHEQVHVERYDAFLKGLAWIALSLHWFNPVLWLAYRLLCQDVEALCDQKVIDGFDPESRREDTAGYAAALYHLGRRERLPQAVLPFGEENAKGRIKHVLTYRKPAKWAAVLLAVLCVAVGVLIGLNGPTHEETVKFGGLTIRSALVQEKLFTVRYQGNHTAYCSDALSADLLEELVTVLKNAPSEGGEFPGPEIVGDGADTMLTGAVSTIQCNGNGFGMLSVLPDGTVIWQDHLHQTYRLFPGLRENPDYLAWADRLNESLTAGRAREMYALSEKGTSLQVIDRAPDGLLYATGIRKVFPGNAQAVITLEDRTLTVRLTTDQNLDYNDAAFFRQAFDQFLREASLRTIALLDNVDTVAYLFADGRVAALVSLPLSEKPDQETFVRWCVYGFDGAEEDWDSVTRGSIVEDLYSIPIPGQAGMSEASRNVDLPGDLVAELVSILAAQSEPLPHDRDSSRKRGGLIPAEGFEQIVSLGGGEKSCVLYAQDGGTVAMEEYEGEKMQIRSVPGLRNDPAWKAWQAHLTDWLTNGRPDSLYEKGLAWRQGDSVDALYDLLYEAGIRVVLPSYVSSVEQEETQLVFRMREFAEADERSMYYLDRKDLFEQVFDQYLKEASLRVIAVLDGVTTISYVYPDGTAGPMVSLAMDRPSREAFRDLYANGFEGLPYYAEHHPPFRVVNGTYSYDRQTAADERVLAPAGDNGRQS